ncbi:MAG TPA: GNAT family N-acetyltransferase [Nocardioidaceae bacterium]|nr:GNAT family N-acetyltransferase [Nocardioidaceae bacterium]
MSPPTHDDHVPPTAAEPPATTPRGVFALRPLDRDSDLALLHAWMDDPAVARFWELDGPRSRLLGHLDTLFDGTHSRPYLGLLDGTPVSYWELYWAWDDPLADHYAARPGDAGLHLLIGPARFRGVGLAAPLIRAVSDRQLAHRRTERVVAEPDVRNTASVRAFERAGFRRTSDLRLPEKTAALMVRDPDTTHDTAATARAKDRPDRGPQRGAHA